MELVEFLRHVQADVRAEIADRMAEPDTTYPFPESVFADRVMQHMAENGMTFEPVSCHYESTERNAKLRLSGYAISEDSDQLDLFVSLYEGVNELTAVPDKRTETAVSQCARFLTSCVEGRLRRTMDPSHDAYGLVMTIEECYAGLEDIRIYVITDMQAKAKHFNPMVVGGTTVKLVVMDIERLHRHWSEGKPRDELIVNFEEISGGALPCVYVRGELDEYDYALTAIPGEAMRYLYERYGPRLLEANVRSFLSMTGKVNRGIRDTLREEPERFMAYNNGIVIVADELSAGQAPGGGMGILGLKGMQIVNGGQTTASIYFTRKRHPEIDLGRVRVPAKIIILKSEDPGVEEALISDISRYANSQNAVRQSDLSANKPFHIEIEKLASSTYCPDGIGQWFYERAAGSYKTMLAREGTTPARLKKLKQAVPPARKITKTDLAKFLNAWDQYPDDVSFGAQKNFLRFMERIGGDDAEGDSVPLPDLAEFKRMISKAILFKATQKLITRQRFPAFQANIATYTVALVANRLGERLNLDRIWHQQDISEQLKEQIQTWSGEVHDILQRTAQGRMISEWAKKRECWEAVRNAKISPPAPDIPEAK